MVAGLGGEVEAVGEQLGGADHGGGREARLLDRALHGRVQIHQAATRQAPPARPGGAPGGVLQGASVGTS